ASPGGRPTHAPAGLKLESGVVVVLDLGPEYHVQPLRNESNLILHEPGEPLSPHVGRQKGQHWSVLDAVVDESETEAPDDTVAPHQNSMVLEVYVVGIEVFDKRAGNVAMGPVVVELQSRIGRPRKRMRPAPQRVAAAYGDIPGARLGDPAVVQISLQ